MSIDRAGMETIGTLSESPKTLSAIRNQYAPESFVLDFQKAARTSGNGTLVEFGNVASFPVLTMPDIEISVGRVTIEEGYANHRHIHPRGAEVIYMVDGLMEVYFETENEGNGQISNTLPAGLAAVIPQGLIHGQTCLKGPCVFIAVLKSADPGNYKIMCDNME